MLTRPELFATVSIEGEEAMAAQDIRQTRAAYLSALQARRKELQDELRGIEAQIAAIHAQATLSPARRRGPRQGESIKEQVAQLLRTSQEPMYAGDIVDALLAQGVQLSEKDPRGVVVTAARRLIKHGRAVQTGPNTFAAVDGK